MSFSENEKEDDEDFYRIEKSIIEDLSHPKNVSNETNLTLFTRMLDISNMTEFAKSNSEFKNEIVFENKNNKGNLIKDQNIKLGIKTKTKIKKRTKKKRCPVCNKKLKLVNFKCKCDKIFCALHRMPEQHNCLYDFKTEGRDKIRKDNPRVVAEKIRKI